MDQALAALIGDIYDRGLDRRILVVVVGEFGRTPKMRYGPPDQSFGRDHWPDAYTALLSGGGLRMGQVIGATNSKAEYPVESPYTPYDLLARSTGICRSTIQRRSMISPDDQYTFWVRRSRFGSCCRPRVKCSSLREQ